jgi:predicted  nucleic acid-binding Zn-ribbon protein
MPIGQDTEPTTTDLFTDSSPLGSPDDHRDVLRAIEAARRSHVELERRSLGLKTAIRREEQTVAKWRRQIQETEELLARWRLILAESETRLERTRHELAALGSRYREADGPGQVA